MTAEITQQRLMENLGPRRGRGRWKIGAAIFLLAVAAQVALWIYFQDDRTFSKMSVLFVWPAALFFLAIWWTFFSAQLWRVRLGLWAVLAVAGVALWNIYAFDGVDGEMVPRFRYRWEKSRKQEVEELFANQSTASPAAGESAAQDDLGDAPPLEAAEGDWTGFRGPNRDGIVRGVKLLSDWNQHPPKELWRHPVGLAWSGFAIVGEFAFTQEQRGTQECVVCYRLDDGAEVWVHGDETRLEIVEANGGDGPHSTPVFHDGQLFTLGGTGILNALDARTGRRLWQREILKDAGDKGPPIKNVEWGLSQSPLVIDDLVIVSPGVDAERAETEFNRATIAYDRQTGEIVWTAGKYPAGYASPHAATIHGVPQVLIFHGTGIAGHALGTGAELWNYEWVNGPKVNAAQPIAFDDGSVVFGCGYGVGSARVELQPKTDSAWETKLRWKSPKFRPKFNDFVLRDGYLYGLDDGILTCIDVETGKTKWKMGRYGYGQLLLVDDLLVILAEQGELVLVEASPEGHRQVAIQGALEPICWNHLALARGKLLVRNSHTAACYELP